MKNMRIRFLLYILIFALACSCKKIKSSDTPLPKVYKPSVLIGCDNNKFYCLDAETGNKNWEFQTDGGVETTACLYNDVVYFGCNSGKFYALNAKTGNEIWHKQLNGSIKSSACVGNDRIYFGCNNDTLYCLDLNGNEVWKYDMGGDIICSPLYYGNKIFCGSRKVAEFKCLNATTGAFIWKQTNFSGGSYAFASSPCRVDTLVVYGYDGDYLLNSVFSNGGPKIQNFTTGYEITGGVESSPISYGGMILFGGNDNQLHCRDTKYGDKRWEFKTAAKIFSSPCIDELRETVFVGSNDFNLYAINFVDGQLRWKHPAGSIIKSSPVAYNSTVYFSCFDKYVYAVNASNGSLKWKHNIDAQSMCSPVIDDLKDGIHPGISGMSKY